MSGRVRFHVNNSNGKLKKRIQTDAEKIFILINDVLSGEPSITDSFSMNQVHAFQHNHPWTFLNYALIVPTLQMLLEISGLSCWSYAHWTCIYRKVTRLCEYIYLALPLYIQKLQQLSCAMARQWQQTAQSDLCSQDVSSICTNGTRICRCMSDYFIFMKRYTEIRSALILSKCLKQRLWETTPYQLKQLVGVGMVTAKVIT